MMSDNEQAPEIERLDRHEFNLDTDQRQKLVLEGEEKIKQVCSFRLFCMHLISVFCAMQLQVVSFDRNNKCSSYRWVDGRTALSAGLVQWINRLFLLALIHRTGTSQMNIAISPPKSLGLASKQAAVCFLP